MKLELIDDRIIEILRRKTPAGRIAMILDANDTARSLVTVGIRHRHSDWDEQQLQAEVARRMLGDTTRHFTDERKYARPEVALSAR